MEDKTLDPIRKTLMGLAQEKLLLAHSGGIDSSVLADLLLTEKIPFSVAHCNFQLREKESDEDAFFVKNWCEVNQIRHHAKRFDTLQYKKEHKLGTQEAARTLRYQWFESLREIHGYTAVLTAHHLNDQLESFLMYSTRGTGLNGLLGIPESDWVRRPLLSVTKEEIRAYAIDHQILWREDSSNDTEDYLRNQFRQSVVATIVSIQPKALLNFKTTLNHLTAANDFIQDQLRELKSKIFYKNSDSTTILLSALEALPQKEFCIHHWFSPLGFASSEVLKLLQAPKGKALYSATHRLMRERDSFVLTLVAEDEISEFHFEIETPKTQLPISLKWEVQVNEGKIYKDTFLAALDKKKLKKTLLLRKYQKGDYFYPTGMQGKKLLSKFFKDEKYSTLQKEAQWILCSGDQIVWVVGKRCDNRFAANETTEEILLMKCEL
ncbi:MAG: tRNA lysidine(34) synthetase TilS [Bacteroidetes bacterium]|nr:tRNA lysidine(34) synthetase TilS [Bacteroidota bacterium]